MGCEGSKASQSKLYAEHTIKASSTRSEYSSTVGSVPKIHSKIKETSGAFCSVKNLNGKKTGGLHLMHFPGGKHIKALADKGCDVVVTLQKDAEGAKNVGKMCEKVGIKWIQIDFWKLYHKKDTDALYTEVERIAEFLKKGNNVMIHCAAGIHRTGMFTYSILRSLSYSSKAAIGSLEVLRSVTFKRVGFERISATENFFEDHFPYTDVVAEGSLQHLQPRE